MPDKNARMEESREIGYANHMPIICQLSQVFSKAIEGE